jgi:hypothetical protein
MSIEARLEDLRVEARYWRERTALYRAKAFRGKPTRPARLAELERSAAGADERLKRAEAAARRSRD